MNILDLSGIRQRVENEYYDNKLSYPGKTENMRAGYITDEDKSVRWNKEQVDLANINYRKAQDDYNNEENRLESLFRQDIIDCLCNHYHLTNKAAELIFNKGYEDGHADGYLSVLDCIYNDLVFFIDVSEANKKVNL